MLEEPTRQYLKYQMGFTDEDLDREEGFKAINPKITFKLAKTREKGDPYFEAVIDFKDE